jgi:hypothetical protein
VGGASLKKSPKSPHQWTNGFLEERRRRRRSFSYSMILYPGFESLAAPWAPQKGNSNVQRVFPFSLSVHYYEGA